MKANWFIGLPAPMDVVLDAPAGVRLFAATDLHLTVAFLGGVPEEQARAAFAEAKAVAVTVRLGEARALGDPKAPSALSVIADDDEGTVAELIGQYRDRLLRLVGLEAEVRKPLPHITFARIQRRATELERAAALAWWAAAAPTGLQCEVSEVALFTWSKDRSKSLFRLVERRGAGD